MERELVSLFLSCDRGMAGFIYPDGRAPLDQPLRLVQAFNVIGVAMAAGRKRQG